MHYKLTIFLFYITILTHTLFASSSEKIGDALRIIIPATAYGTTLYLDDREGQYQFYKSFATNAVVTYGLKYTVDKERPNGEKYSFPSGHTSFAFQGATFIHRRYGFYYSLLAYVGAVYVGYSRVDSKNHYTSDVIAGALIGSLSSFFFTNEYQVEALHVENGYGVKISYAW